MLCRIKRKIMRYRSMKYFYIAAVLLFLGNLLGSCVVFLQVRDTTHFYFVNPLSYLTRGNTECYRKLNENTANITRASYFSVQSIFFHSLSCNKIVDERGACAIESAARLHPEMSVNLLFSCAVSRETWSNHLDRLIKLPNFRLVGMHVEGYANGTEFETFWRSVITHNKIANPAEAAEYVKFLTLHRFGGVVLDLDVIVNKPLKALGYNWVVKDGEWILGTDAISIPRSDVGRNVTAYALRFLSKQIMEGRMNASIALGNALVKLCPDHDFSIVQLKTCFGFEVYDDQLFHPISRENWQFFYQPGSYNQKAFAHRLWNEKRLEIDMAHNTLYANLAQEFCPSVYSRAHNVF